MTPLQQQQRQEKITYWQPHIEQWRGSQVTAKQYCEQHQLNHGQFKYWQYQLAPDTKHAAKTTTPLTFSEARVTQNSSTTQGFIIQTPNGYRVSVACHSEMKTLRHLLTMIKELSC